MLNPQRVEEIMAIIAAMNREMVIERLKTFRGPIPSISRTSSWPTNPPTAFSTSTPRCASRPKRCRMKKSRRRRNPVAWHGHPGREFQSRTTGVPPVLFSWMKLFVDRLQPPLIDVRINLCSAHIAVPQQFLHNSQIRPATKQMTRKAMPQNVRRDVF